MSQREDVITIVKKSVQAVMPQKSVREAISELELQSDRLYLVAAGKAAYTMAKAAETVLGQKIRDGVVITKYGHAKTPLQRCRIFEAGHPSPDQNSYEATQKAIDLVYGLTDQDEVLFLLSGGASSLFEVPIIPEKELEQITEKLLGSGADIHEINLVRKHLSQVKGGRFALACFPAKVHVIVLSDVIGNDLSTIGSGPCYPDNSTGEEAFSVLEKYHINLNADIIETLMLETPKYLNNVDHRIIGDVSKLCTAAKDACEALGYRTVILTDSLNCEARDAGAFLSSIARYYQGSKRSLAFIAGGETVVKIKGTDLGGRNQELVLSAAEGISGLKDTMVLSFGSDGTDGPTDAAGAYADGETAEKLQEQSISIYDTLENNDSYHALQAVKSLIVTGPTGTNVNDVAIILIKR